MRHFGGGHANHSLFWTILTPRSGTQPSGALLEAIERHFGGMDECRKALVQVSMSQLGSGWGWLVVDHDRRLLVGNTPNQDSPLMVGNIPILGIDIWEHAYYLKYHDRRNEYIEALFNLFDWEAIGRRCDIAIEKLAQAAPRAGVR